MGECVEAAGIVQRRACRRGEFGQEELEVRGGRRAVDAKLLRGAVLDVFDLAGVARRAGHAELAGRGIAVDDKADRQPFRIPFGRFVVRQIAVALQLVAAERLVDVEPPQRLEPGVGHHVRSLARRVEGLAFVQPCLANCSGAALD